MGKSSIIQRFVTNQYVGDTVAPTYGVEFVSKDIAVNEKKIRVQVWDTVESMLSRPELRDINRLLGRTTGLQ